MGWLEFCRLPALKKSCTQLETPCVLQTGLPQFHRFSPFALLFIGDAAWLRFKPEPVLLQKGSKSGVGNLFMLEGRINLAVIK
jgi:hypothetical protein